ncbi:hypothetical protein B0H10DRAFT_1821682, partial [Mycena sp. CBHHK59/15]
WKSTPSCPTQRGIMADYKTVIHHTLSTFPNSKIVLWVGQPPHVCSPSSTSLEAGYAKIQGLVLENPFASIPRMVRTLYGQRWLPYHYLAPLAWDKWDAAQALSSCAGDSALARLAPNMLVLLSEHDEVVPNEMGEELCAIGNSRGDGTMGGRVIPAALHDNAHVQWVWRSEMQRYIADVERLSKSDVA